MPRMLYVTCLESLPRRKLFELPLAGWVNIPFWNFWEFGNFEGLLGDDVLRARSPFYINLSLHFYIGNLFKNSKIPKFPKSLLLRINLELDLARLILIIDIGWICY